MALGRPAHFDITATDKTARAFGSVSRRMGALGGQMRRVGGMALGFAGVGGFGAMTKAAINTGSAISDQSVQLRVGIEELQVMQDAATEAGVANSILERSLRNVNGRVQAAADGNKTYNEAIERLGLSTDELLNMPLERRMEAIGKAYQNAGDKSAAYRDVQQILGERAGPQLLEVLQRLGTEGFDAMAEKAKANGQVMSEETAMAMDKMADRIEAFKKKATIKVATIMDEAQSEQGRKNLLFGMLSAAAKFGGFLIDAAIDFGRTLGAVMSASFKHGWAVFKGLFTGEGPEGTLGAAVKKAYDGVEKSDFGKKLGETSAKFWQDKIVNTADQPGMYDPYEHKDFTFKSPGDVAAMAAEVGQKITSTTGGAAAVVKQAQSAVVKRHNEVVEIMKKQLEEAERMADAAENMGAFT